MFEEFTAPYKNYEWVNGVREAFAEWFNPIKDKFLTSKSVEVVEYQDADIDLQLYHSQDV